MEVEATFHKAREVVRKKFLVYIIERSFMKEKKQS